MVSYLGIGKLVPKRPSWLQNSWVWLLNGLVGLSIDHGKIINDKAELLYVKLGSKKAKSVSKMANLLSWISQLAPTWLEGLKKAKLVFDKDDQKKAFETKGFWMFGRWGISKFVWVFFLKVESFWGQIGSSHEIQAKES